MNREERAFALWCLGREAQHCLALGMDMVGLESVFKSVLCSYHYIDLVDGTKEPVVDVRCYHYNQCAAGEDPPGLGPFRCHECPTLKRVKA